MEGVKEGGKGNQSLSIFVLEILIEELSDERSQIFSSVSQMKSVLRTWDNVHLDGDTLAFEKSLKVVRLGDINNVILITMDYKRGRSA
jgi:hypothetical protein